MFDKIGAAWREKKDTPDARFVVDDDRIIVYVVSRYASRCQDIPGGTWDSKLTAYTWPALPRIARALRETFDGCKRTGNPDFVDLLNQPDATEQAAEVLEQDVNLGDIPLLKTDPWRHQRMAYAFTRQLWGAAGGGAMLALDMGTGKSKVAVDLMVNMGLKRVLILAPKSVVTSVWPRQIQQHAAVPYDICALGYQASIAEKRETAEVVLRYSASRNMPCAVIINYESAFREPFASWSIKQAHFDGLIMDECHRIKAPGGRTSLYCARLAKAIRYRLGLTGTPMPHSPLDVYAQMRAIDPTIFGTSYASFQARYAQMNPIFKRKLMKIVNQMELNLRFYSVAYRVEAKDVLDLPPVQHIDRECELGPQAEAIYTKLDEDFTVWLHGENPEDRSPVTAANVLVKLIRLQQITSGFVRDDNKVDHEIDTSKREALADIMAGLPPEEPLVVFCRFHHDLDAVQAACLEQGRAYSEVSGRFRQDAATIGGKMDLVTWQNGGASVIGVQIQSGGVGLDLARARYVVYYSLGYSLGDYDQSLARIIPRRMHHENPRSPVTIYHLIASGTKDVDVYKALQARRNLVDDILNMDTSSLDKKAG